MRLYVNGVLDKENTTGIESSQCNPSTRDLWIGRSISWGGTFDGVIDNVRIYNYARTPAQIAWGYNRGGPIGWWKFDECQGSTAYDSSGNGNNGTITPGGAPNTSVGTCSSGAGDEMWDNGTTGKRNASLDFDGTNDNVVVTDSSDFNFANDTFSISAWFKTSDTGVRNTIFYRNITSPTRYVDIFVHTDDRLWLETKDSADVYLNSISPTGTNYHDGNWHHVVAIRDNDANTLDLYVDGKLSGSTPDTRTGDFNYEDIYIGSKTDGSMNHNGQIDDVQIYNYALTEQQVRGAMNEGSAVRFGPNTGSP